MSADLSFEVHFFGWPLSPTTGDADYRTIYLNNACCKKGNASEFSDATFTSQQSEIGIDIYFFTSVAVTLQYILHKAGQYMVSLV